MVGALQLAADHKPVCQALDCVGQRERGNVATGTEGLEDSLCLFVLNRNDGQKDTGHIEPHVELVWT